MPERTVWSRVEPRPRSDEMDDGLAARVQDPLWMLSRQWQVSEFRGEDAGSPVRVDLSVAQDDLTRVDLRGGGRADPDPFDYDGGPLEALVEREAVTSDDDGPPLRVRAETGQQFRRRLAEAGYGEYTAGDFPDALVLSDPGEAMPAEDRRYVELLSGRTLDGTAVARAIRSAVGNIDAVVAGEAPSWSGVTAADLPLPESGSRTGVFEDCVESFYAWYTDLYDEPTVETGSAWDPTRLEYRFAVATGEGDTETVFEAPGYQGGRLDWHAFSPDEMGASLGAGNSSTGTGNGQGESASAGDYSEGHATTVREKSVVPSQISFPGMPAPRWWEFEDGDTDLAEVAADGASLSRLTLVEFATQYGNDWFQIPVETPVGTCSRVTDLTVTDSFGVTASASAALDEDWQLFMHDLPGEPGLFVPPTLSDSMTGDPVERVVFARDEVANLAFAIERTIESPTGRALDRTEFQQPRLVVDSVATSTDPDAEYVQLANPGEDRLFVAGHEIQAETDGNTTSVYTIARQELGPGETMRVYTGTGDDDGVSAGLSASVWTSADTAQVANENGRVVARHLLSRPSEALADYRLSTDVPPYWFPFTDAGDERLERALLLDAESLGLPIESIPRPLGEILRPESDLLPAGEDTYQVHDEEITRTGREVTRQYQYARWSDGAGHLWSTRESRPGDTQLTSGLQFDILDERE
jgi:hypothetical protein